MKYITHFSRILVGIAFIFSGFVKTVDPIGFSYKLEEYFSESVFNITFLEPYSLPLSVFFVVFEVVLGIFLLLGIYRKFTLRSLLLLIVFFSFLTFYSAYFDKVRDCGCFGDFIKLKPWESFYKDLILLFFILILFAGKNYIKPLLNLGISKFIAFVGTLISIWIAYEGVFNLPIIDYRAYAEGNSLIEGRKSAEELGLNPPELATIYTLIHQKTKETKVMDDQEYIDSKIWEDSLWVIDTSKTKTIEKKEGYTPPIPPDFEILCNSTDRTDEVLNYDRVVIITILNIKELGVEEIAKIRKLKSDLTHKGIKLIILANDTTNIQLSMCTMDIKVMKTINRSHVGIMLLKKGVVLKKYSYSKFPTIKEIIKIFNT
ncbi:MAG: DoxX family protein [Flavobacteriales bacterium]|nr:DoxX family protein [Flavobacteriales bacterium]